MGENYSLSSPHRRLYERFELEGAGTVFTGKGEGDRLLLKDLSQSGAGVLSSRPLSVNDKMTVTIMASLFNKPLSRQAKVVWCEKMDRDWYRAGLDFGMDNRIDFTKS